MATIKEVIEKGFIAVEDDITFDRHRDVMSLFGNDQINPRLSFYPHPHEEGVHIWFPMFYDDKNNDWDNTRRDDWETVFERRKHDNEGYLNVEYAALDRHKRILFAKIKQGVGMHYEFKGLYNFDAEISRAEKKAAYRRIARRAKLYVDASDLD